METEASYHWLWWCNNCSTGEEAAAVGKVEEVHLKFSMQGDVGTSSSEDECLAVMAFALTKRKRKHKMWVRSAFANKEKSCYNLIKELSMWDHEMYFRYMRMSTSRFEHLLTLIASKITKKKLLSRANPTWPKTFPDASPSGYWRVSDFSELTVQNRTANHLQNNSRNLQGYQRRSSPWVCKHANFGGRMACCFETFLGKVGPSSCNWSTGRQTYPHTLPKQNRQLVS